jgi:hypothetical protein
LVLQNVASYQEAGRHEMNFLQRKFGRRPTTTTTEGGVGGVQREGDAKQDGDAQQQNATELEARAARKRAERAKHGRGVQIAEMGEHERAISEAQDGQMDSLLGVSLNLKEKWKDRKMKKKEEKGAEIVR